MAGVLSPKSIKLYTKFWFEPPFDDWIVLDDAGNFSSTDLESRLMQKII